MFVACGDDDAGTTPVTSITLKEKTLTLAVGKDSTLTATVSPADATDKTVTWTSSDATKATVSSSGKVTAVAVGTANIIAQAGDKKDTCAVTVNPAGITTDAGVEINGVTWATANVDAPGTFAASPTDPGKFYQWNRKRAWSATGWVSGWDVSVPTGSTWEAANDPCPAGWRLPTEAELNALIDPTKVTFELIGPGKFTDITTSTELILPIAGRRDFTGETQNENTGFYWSSDRADNYSYYLDISQGWLAPSAYVSTRNGGEGMLVRCVAQ
ncbi:hypothetical protein AGMMS49982_00140 [Bacteroidia bacterium]|nr:hypothetical protein AGMMS49982_00140 [Bacteroidia bacterium]